MLCHLSEVKKQYPVFEPGWKSAGTDTIVANEQFGCIMHAVVCRADRSPIYDLPVWAEPRGAVCVPLTPDGRLVMVEQRRAVPLSGVPENCPSPDLSAAGRVSLEFPRGFAEPGESAEQAAVREVAEEIGYDVAELEVLGETNSNTTYFLTSVPVFVAKLGKRTVRKDDERERIERVREMSLAEIIQAIVSGEIVCGITKSALMMYVARFARVE